MAEEPVPEPGSGTPGGPYPVHRRGGLLPPRATTQPGAKMDRYAVITAMGSHLPGIRVHNDDLRQRFAHLPDFVDKMEESSGIRCRWHAPEDWATSDLALPAARQALERAHKRPEDVDLIILGTDSPDYITPATSVVLQHKLGAVNAGTFDVGCACASFPTGLSAGAGIIAANPGIKTVLVVGVYLMHKLTSAADPMVFFYGLARVQLCSNLRLRRALSLPPSAPTALITTIGEYI